MTNSEKVYLYGVGGHADVVADVLRTAGFSVAGVFDDDPKKVATEHALPGLQIEGAEKFASLQHPIIITIGDNLLRKTVADQLECPFATAVHPSSLVADSTVIGEGCMLIHGSIVQSGTKLGRHAIVNTAASIDHDCIVGDFAHISPNATLCGNVRVGEGTHIGAGATVIPGIRIGNWCRVGAGAVVIEDIEDNRTAVGVPSRIIRRDARTTSTLEPAQSHSQAGTESLSPAAAILLTVINQVRSGSKQTPLIKLQPEHGLQSDLGLDSLQLAELAVRIEAECGVDVFADGIVRTVGELLARLER